MQVCLFKGEIPKARKLFILSELRYFVCYHVHRNKINNFYKSDRK